MKPTNRVFGGLGTTVFEVMSGLAREHGAINLGQGFPDVDGPEDVRRAAADATMEGPNQYPPMLGIPELRQAIAGHNRRFYGLEVDWRTETLVTSGATEALGSCLMGSLNPGDEVVLIEPMYDSYLPIIRLVGAVPKVVAVEAPGWTLPREKLAAAFSSRTKALVLNSPMNPVGKVFDRDELGFIADLVVRHDAVAICDEVYEHLVFDGLPHIPLMTLPGMRERTLRIGSAGKIFSLTGWKVGWVTGAPKVLESVAKAHQFLTFTTAPNLQRGVAYGLGKADDYFQDLAGEQQRKRDLLGKGLARIGFDVLPSGGTYFISADFRPLGFNGTDVDFCRHITAEAKVAAVPVSAFYDGEPVRHLARFCFCKRDEILTEAVERLAWHFGR
ncbi:MAG: aminotransferase [Alphaproteobacteria bacterium]|nr:aminotransferase [Alphaproteobacteria bacterium]